MPNFVSKSEELRKKYEERKLMKVKASPSPISDMCSHCWYQSSCLLRFVLRQQPNSCCVYEFFGPMGNDEASLEEVVAFTCDIRCKDRREWAADPCPHNEEYCTNHCPVSKMIMGKSASDIEDVPYEEY